MFKKYSKNNEIIKTSLFNKKIVDKSSKIISLIGDIDELVSFLDLILADNFNKIDLLTIKIVNKYSAILKNIMQSILFSNKYIITNNDIKEIEKKINDIYSSIEDIKIKFIRFDDEKISSQINFARTICRRAERSAIKLFMESNLLCRKSLLFINRLSDLLFVLALRIKKMDKNEDKNP